MTNTVELEKKIEDSGLKRNYIAQALGLSRQGFRNKCINKQPFNTREINILCELLKISKLSEKENIFFAR